MTRTLFVGGHLYGAADRSATALVVDGDQIAWLGSDSAAAVHRDAVDHVVELDGTLLTPAFVDAHVHTTSMGLALLGLDLSTTSSVGDLLQRLEAHCRASRGGVILGHGWDESAWVDARPPTRQEIDRASYGSVVYLSRIDVHSCLASSALLAIAPDAKMQAGFDESGWLKQRAHHTVRAAAFESITPDQTSAAQLRALQHAASLGVGMLHELGGPDINGAADFQNLLVLAAREPGPEVVGYWGVGGGPEEAIALGARGAAGDLFVDGAIGSRTALLRKPYQDEATLGARYLTAADIRDHIIACSRQRVQAGFHVIGDGAMDLVAAAFNEAVEQVGIELVRAARHRLEHVEMVDASHIALFAKLGLVASVQPLFDALWGGDSGMYVGRLGRDRAATLNPFAAMVTAGIPLALGSDAPVTPLGPWAAVRAAAHHQTPQHRISTRDAFEAHTSGGWRAAAFDEGGVLAAGAPANLAIWRLDDQTLQQPGNRIADRSTAPGLPILDLDSALPTCLRTVVRGSTVFLRD